MVISFSPPQENFEILNELKCSIGKADLYRAVEANKARVEREVKDHYPTYIDAIELDGGAFSDVLVGNSDSTKFYA